MISSKFLYTWYDHYNRRYFGGELPNDIALHFEIHEFMESKEKGHVLFGRYSRRSVNSGRGVRHDIAINTDTRPFEELVKQILLHEMVHVKLQGPGRAHGPRFRKEIRRLVRAGAYADLL